jgi:hypothetical protein
MEARRIEADLSIPVVWTQDDWPPVAGRIDLTLDGVHLDGGARGERRTLDLPYGEISSVRIGRNGSDRIDGRRAVVLALHAGGSVSFVAFDRPGSALELAHRLEERL